MRAQLGRLWGAAPRPLRLASTVLAAGAAVDISMVLVDLALSGEDVKAVATAALLVTLTGLLGDGPRGPAPQRSRVAWLLSVVLLVAGLTAVPVDAAPVSLALLACHALALVLLPVPGTMRAVWQRPCPCRQPQDFAVRTGR
jgi:hypothetical protein